MIEQMDLGSISSLWRKYKRTKSIEIRNKLVELHLDLVKKIAKMTKSRLPCFVGLDDLISVGVFGLIDAVENFDLSRGVKFETYCCPRIKGAILDELRQMDWVPRLVRSHVRKYKEAVEALGDGNGDGNGNSNVSSLQEIADYFNVSINKAERITKDGCSPVTKFCPMAETSRRDGELEEFSKGCISSNVLPNKDALTPDDELSKNDGFKELISFLRSEEQIVVTLYYRDDYEVWKIGEILGLSESRISQMISDTLRKIKDSLV